MEIPWITTSLLAKLVTFSLALLYSWKKKWWLQKTKYFWTSGQDGGVGGYTVPPRTTKRRTTTNLKTKNNQNCQKIKLHGSMTTKELKKKHSSRLVGGAEMGSWDGVDSGQSGGWKTGAGEAEADGVGGPTLACGETGTTGEWDSPRNPGFQYEEIKPQNLWLKKPVGVEMVGETPSLTGEFVGETRRDPQSPRTYTKLPTWKSAPEGPNLFVGSGGGEASRELTRPRSSLSDPSPIYSATT